VGEYLKIISLALVLGLWVLTGCGRQAAYAPAEVEYDLYATVIYEPEPESITEGLGFARRR
jgi:hypothetical protein